MNALERYWTALGQGMDLGLKKAASGGDSFSRIATDTLTEVAVPPIDAVAIAEWSLSRDSLPKQVNFHSGFGQPPLVVYEASDFYIEVLFWFPSRTVIHGHGFSGAFRVLSGYSVQAEYNFVETESWENTRAGRLDLRGLDLLLPGHVYAIDNNDSFVHTVAHVGNPSLTLVARTHRDESSRQFNFYRCGFAVRSHLHKQDIERRAQVLISLRQTHPEKYSELLDECLENSDDYRFFKLLKALLDAIGAPEFSVKMLPGLELRFGRRRALPVAAIKEEIKRSLEWNFIRAERDKRRRLRLVLDELGPDRRRLEAMAGHASREGDPSEGLLNQWLSKMI